VRCTQCSFKPLPLQNHCLFRHICCSSPQSRCSRVEQWQWNVPLGWQLAVARAPPHRLFPACPPRSALSSQPPTPPTASSPSPHTKTGRQLQCMHLCIPTDMRSRDAKKKIRCVGRQTETRSSSEAQPAAKQQPGAVRPKTDVPTVSIGTAVMTICSTFGTALGHQCFLWNSGTVLERSYTSSGPRPAPARPAPASLLTAARRAVAVAVAGVGVSAAVRRRVPCGCVCAGLLRGYSLSIRLSISSMCARSI
jgi:hypothetical protein